MKRVPESRGVSQALRALRTATRRSLAGLNQLAAQRMAKGDYGSAEALAAKGREIREFAAEVDALRQRWKEIGAGGSGAAGEQTTPLWAYYQPILRALIDAGGEATRADLEPRVDALMRDSLQPADHVEMARGRERWKVMLRRARKHIAEEGWIEDGRARVWCITEAGRRAAKETEAQATARR